HETDRRGTTYRVALPQEVAAVRELMEQVADLVSEAPLDFYTDPVRRTELQERDGYCCRYCGQLVSDRTCTLDHILPRSKGGPNTAENLATCCLMCNAIKSGRTYEEAAPELLRRVAQLRSNSRADGTNG
ncbi:MAG: HNH endonuclease, partial [Actinobacteria bacterium]|nr:HNH endonuclease [Actinomycetota bacterium]